MSELAECSDPRYRDLVAVGSNRPRNSPGWGMLVAVKSGVVVSPDGTERDYIKANRRRVRPDHWIAKAYPEMFRPACDKRDTGTRDAHKRNLEHVLRYLERGRAAGRSSYLYGQGVLPRQPTRPVLPPRKGSEPWRLR